MLFKRMFLAIVASLVFIPTAYSQDIMSAQEFNRWEYARKNPQTQVRTVARVRSVQPVRQQIVRQQQQQHPVAPALQQHTEVAPNHDFGSSLQAAEWIKHHVNRNPTGWSCLWCGRMIRLAAMATGHNDCAVGDVAPAWKHCTKPAPAGAIGSVRWTPQHVGMVVANTKCPKGTVQMASGNSYGATTRETCEPLYQWGVGYGYLIKGNARYAMQPDPCRQGGAYYGSRRAVNTYVHQQNPAVAPAAAAY